ncbi:glycoside hydrolase family 76 protein [Suhomyces tanzawaensis NRRL Y-17324]|uniref:Mannan endo-1,6-alpha-mannosidase n=1 Tax=Suhomyces tanzawaensis NRRL Y-17324 TaxID=984487 RepID=A0A1E4SJG6_9ASCO|nr:glycoside hydrolase family 76 protein [Suhomyces tanzawaensis NRRL Y-17324]ODV79644.1 glycoside hydrolase family 76 protein [Suhomyces tanzawaensis NRRL Y-17324]
MRFNLANTVAGFAVELDINDKDSICAAAKVIMDGELNYYEGTKKGGVVGMFAPPNYWWNAGEAFGGLVDYYTFCDSGNLSLEKLILDGMFHQAGENFNYIPSNQSMTEGNDDQGVWGLATLQALERNFTEPENHSWLSLSQAIYNTINARWDMEECGGGLRWQIFTWNSGYNYKNSISNGCLFNLAARLARYTGNDTYVATAEKVWDWMVEAGFMVEIDGQAEIYDGAQITNNCSEFTKTKWSYTYGVFMSGAAYLYNFTGDDKWLTRTEELVKSSGYFFNNSIMFERSCAVGNHCNNDQRSFRSLFSRLLALTGVIAPTTRSDMLENIQKSAAAAAQSCSGGSDGVTCGENWSVTGWDGIFGLGEQMSALETVQALLVLAHDVPLPLSVDTGGTSKSDPNAGINDSIQTNKNLINVKGKDKAGAGFLTAIALAIILAGAVWMVL